MTVTSQANTSREDAVQLAVLTQQNRTVQLCNSSVQINLSVIVLCRLLVEASGTVLPLDVISAPTLAVFLNRLKTYLCSRSLPS